MDKKISIFFLVFVVFFIGCFYYASQNGLRGPIREEEKEEEIKTYAIQTHEYYDDITCLKYVIESKDELDVFTSVYEADLKLDDVDFTKNKVFVELEVESSGSVEKEITDFIVEERISFVIKTKSEGVGTDDMALWYYVAIVPDSKLDEVNYAAWQKPSDIIKIEEDNIVDED